VEYKIKDLGLAKEGVKKLEWARRNMPVLMALRERYKKEKPLKGYKVGGSLHVTKETAVLVEAFRDAGADVRWSGCNPLSTQDDVAAALVEEGISVFAWYGMNRDEYYWAIDKVIEIEPDFTVDDGADLIFRLHSKYKDVAKKVIGGTEETTTGIKRLRAMAKDGVLLYPVIAVNNAETKWDFDNIYGTGQSSIDGILRATSILLAGKVFVVAGYGHCGKGVAMRARGMGARVVVVEVDPIKALKAVHDGFWVMPMKEAAKIGDVFITATGVKDIITGEHFAVMKDGAIVCNTGHYDCEINIGDLEEMSVDRREIRDNTEEFVLKDGRKIYLLAKGRLVNLVAAEGHPSEVMDMSFANQFLSIIRLAKEGKSLKPNVYEVSAEQDEEIARVKLATMGIEIDSLTEEQIRYIEDYSEGT